MKFEKLDRAVGRVMFGGGGEFSPTLVVGLGGSGSSTARRAKRILDERYGDLHIIKFLIVDTDTGGYSEEGGMAAVDREERASIVTPNASEVHRQMKDGLKPEIAEFLPDNLNVGLLDTGTGAGAIRPIGRFALFSQMSDFYSDRLRPACLSLNEIETLVREKLRQAGGNITVNSKSPRIYVTCSLCGGTGSSLFIDVAALIRHIFAQIGVTPKIVGVFFLPSVFMSERGITTMVRENIQANGYAALMELEYFCRSDIANEGWEFKYPEVGAVRIDRPLYDEVYLIEGLNSNGKLLSGKNDAFEMTARGICIDIGSPIGTRASSSKLNIMAHLPNRPCKETGQERKMNSFAVTGLKVPADEIARYCCLRAAKEVINDYLLKQPSERELVQEVNQFLNANRLDERGAKDQLLDSLLTTRDGHPMSYESVRTQSQLYAQARNEGFGKREAAYALDWVRSQQQEITSRLVRDAGDLVQQNKETVLQNALNALYAKTGEILGSKGVRHCSEFLKGVLAIFEQTAAELQQESEDVRDIIKGLNEGLDKQEDELKRYTGFIGGLKARLSGADEQITEIALGQLNSLANTLLKQQARQAAIEVLNSQNPIGQQQALIPALKELCGRLFDSWCRLLESAYQLAERELVHHRQNRSSAGQYVLDQIVNEGVDYDEIYEQMQLDLRRMTADYLQEPHDPEEARALEYEEVGPFKVTRNEPEKVVDRLASMAVSEVMNYLTSEMSIGRIFQRLAGRDDKAAAYTKQQLQSMLDKCHPFWTTSMPRGPQSYEQFFAVSVPCLPNDPNQAVVRGTIQEALQERGYDAELVENGYPFVLEICHFAYGARSYYLKSAEEMLHCYTQKSADHNVRMRLHVDKRFVGRIPRIHPEQRAEAVGLFAWGLAYGYIAKDGNFYYVGIDERKAGGQAVPTPKYQTDWEIAVIDLVDEAWRGSPQRNRDVADRLPQGRDNAIEAFANDNERLTRLLNVRQSYLAQWGKERAIRELNEYLTRLDARIRETKNEDMRDLLKWEKEALEGYMQRL